MTTRDDLYRLVAQLRPETLDEAAAALSQYVPAGGVAEPPYPRSIGVLTGAPADLSSRVDDYLEGFGQ
ncbi:hypothetical protein [Streptomyces malaysiensis]|uniref:hypothetical protein n=1 Tax=Streptomyces malaysiensis TaxID=92644 RepID=UPI000BFB3586|nr:hypothetical protein [Streptomyces malaysiensis]ATL88778.1 hypothetical protein SMALA_8632 [Streptomyces malaysiensis]